MSIRLFNNILGKYTDKGSFIFRKTDNLRKLCKVNVPKDICGIYIYTMVYEGKETILYIGCSGHILNGELKIRTKGGLRARIHGKQNKNNRSRDKFYKDVMNRFMVPEVRIFWYNTGYDDPEYIEYQLILKYIIKYKEFPIYNNELKRKDNKSL